MEQHRRNVVQTVVQEIEKYGEREVIESQLGLSFYRVLNLPVKW